jgi:hypothetical protein
MCAVLYYCHRVSTQLQLTNISYAIPVLAYYRSYVASRKLRLSRFQDKRHTTHRPSLPHKRGGTNDIIGIVACSGLNQLRHCVPQT